MKIQVLGTGCAKCEKLAEHAHQAVERAGPTDAAVEKVKDLKEIMAFGVMKTPALAVDGEVKISGRVPEVEEIVDILKGIKQA